MRAWAPNVEAVVARAIDAAAPGAVVAFDADGTLWRGDVGEELLRHLAHQGQLPALQGRGGIYAEYERRVQGDPASGYAWAVEVMAGLSAAQLALDCERFFAERFAGRVFRWVAPLLARLRRAGLEPWVVSASPALAVAAGARALGIPAAQVIGVESAVDGGRLTSTVRTPISCGEGKVAQLAARGLRPVLAFGNGELDLPMLAAAGAAVVVAPPDEPGNALVEAAAARGWPVLRSG